MTLRVGIDTGGTFTDLVAVSETGSWARAKVPSTPHAPVQAVLAALDAAELAADEIDLLVVGTTLGTNALLERRGARVAYLATDGFEDVPFIQRGNRPYHYDLAWRKPKPFLQRECCLGVPERVDRDGREIEPVDTAALDEALDEVGRLDVDAVAVNFLFSYLAPEHEQEVGRRVQERYPEMFVSLSHDVVPVWREYERGITTIADAYLKPLLGRFVTALSAGLAARGFAGRCSLLKSNGGIQVDTEASRRPVELSLSGLAGGVLGGCRFAPPGADVVTMDMGGTSCDLAVVKNGTPRLASTYEPEFGLPLLFPSIEVRTIGAGGGSIAWADDGGFLRVGPRSAGADPGPAAYARGGGEPTLTDANLVLGRLDPDYFLGGNLRLDPEAARAALAPLAQRLDLPLEDTALAIVRVANENMEAAIRERTVEAGIDPRTFTLVAFGGAAPLHAAAIARSLGMRRVLVPPHPGLCSAFGAATAELRSDRLATGYFRSDSVRSADVAAVVSRLANDAVSELRAEGFVGEPEVVTRLGMRYSGQNYEHTVELADARVDDAALADAFAEFEQLHDRFYGYNLRGQAIELVELAVTARGRAESPAPAPDPAEPPSDRYRRVRLRDGDVEVRVVRRASLPVGAVLEGDAIIEEPDSTVLLEGADALEVLPDGTLSIDVEREER